MSPNFRIPRGSMLKSIIFNHFDSFFEQTLGFVVPWTKTLLRNTELETMHFFTDKLIPFSDWKNIWRQSNNFSNCSYNNLVLWITLINKPFDTWIFFTMPLIFWKWLAFTGKLVVDLKIHWNHNIPRNKRNNSLNVRIYIFFKT